jgi:hypothetical protein
MRVSSSLPSCCHGYVRASDVLRQQSGHTQPTRERRVNSFWDCNDGFRKTTTDISKRHQPRARAACSLDTHQRNNFRPPPLYTNRPSESGLLARTHQRRNNFRPTLRLTAAARLCGAAQSASSRGNHVQLPKAVRRAAVHPEELSARSGCWTLPFPTMQEQNCCRRRRDAPHRAAHH